MYWKVCDVRHSNCPLIIPGLSIIDRTPWFKTFKEADEFRNSLKKFKYLDWCITLVHAE